MQFTPQQLAGAQRYTQRTRVGNWLEDMCLEEEKLSEFSRSQATGSLIMNDLYKKQAVYNKPVGLSYCSDGLLRFGDKVMLGNPASGAVLAVDLSESIFESDTGSLLVTGALNASGPVARNVFVICPVAKGPGRDGDVVHFGEPFHLCCHDGLLVDEGLKATRPGFFLASSLKNERNSSRIANQQPVFMTHSATMSAVWTFEKVAGNTGIVRQLSTSEPVPCATSLGGGTVVVQHRATKQALATNVKYLDATDFGRELEVSCHNYFGTHKVEALASEMAGRTTGATNARLEKSPNFWAVIASPEPGPEEALAPPKLTAAGIVDLARDELARIDGAGDRLKQMEAEAPGCVLDREDLAAELRDVGLSFDAYPLKILLDFFDETGDGMIPIKRFNAAML